MKKATKLEEIDQALRLNEPVGPDHKFYTDFSGMRGEFEEKIVYRSLNVSTLGGHFKYDYKANAGNKTLVFLGGMRGTGKTSELLDLVGLSERIFPNIKIVTLTGHPENQLSQLATHALATGNPEEICPLGLTPTTSTSVMKVICDILIARLIEITGFTKADFAKRHHSGYLGERSRA